MFFFVLLLTSMFSMPVEISASESPENLIKKIYKNSKPSENKFIYPAQKPSEYFTESLVDLFIKEKESASQANKGPSPEGGGWGQLIMNPFMSELMTDPPLISKATKENVVQVTFTFYDAPFVIKYHLKLTGNGWRVDEIIYPNFNESGTLSLRHVLGKNTSIKVPNEVLQPREPRATHVKHEVE